MVSELLDNVKIIHENQVSSISIVCTHIMHSHPKLSCNCSSGLSVLSSQKQNTIQKIVVNNTSEYYCFPEHRHFQKQFRHIPVTRETRNYMNNITEIHFLKLIKCIKASYSFPKGLRTTSDGIVESKSLNLRMCVSAPGSQSVSRDIQPSWLVFFGSLAKMIF